MMKDCIQTFPQYKVCVCLKDPVDQLLTESIPLFRVNLPLDRPGVLTNRIWVHVTRDLVHKPDEILEDGLSSVFVCNTFNLISWRYWHTPVLGSQYPWDETIIFTVNTIEWKKEEKKRCVFYKPLSFLGRSCVVDNTGPPLITLSWVEYNTGLSWVQL